MGRLSYGSLFYKELYKKIMIDNGNIFYVDSYLGHSHKSGARGMFDAPYNSIQECHDYAVKKDGGDLIILLASKKNEITTHKESVLITKSNLSIRGPGRDFVWLSQKFYDNLVEIKNANLVSISGCEMISKNLHCIKIINSDFAKIEDIDIKYEGDDAILIDKSEHCHIVNCKINDNFVDDIVMDENVITEKENRWDEDIITEEEKKNDFLEALKKI